MSLLDDVKTILNLTSAEQDQKLETILRMTLSRLCALIGQSECPNELEYIAIEVAVRRFNRIGSEGMSSHNVEGESIAFLEDDFSDFRSDLADWKRAHQADTGRIRFL